MRPPNGVRLGAKGAQEPKPSKNTLVMHVTNGLGNGGAEGVLARLCLNDSANSHFVVSLTGPGKYGEILVAHGIELEMLHIRGLWSAFIGYFRLLVLTLQRRPSVIQSWMPHSDLVASLIRLFVPSSKLVWSIRHGTYEKGSSKKSTRAVVRALAFLSPFAPSKIVSCSEVGVETHIAMGYQPKKFSVIANGTDLDFFSPILREAEGQKPPAKILETSFAALGRFHPQKDHATLLHALYLLERDGFKFKAEIAGIEPLSARVILEKLCNELCLSEAVSIRGAVDNPAEFFMDKDYLVSSSNSGEGFPNVIAEAMACGVPAISTDVGDARLIIGGTGWVVPPRDPGALFEALREACQVSQTVRTRFANSARSRISDSFSLGKMVRAYQSLYDSLRT